MPSITLSRRQIATILSVLYLAALTALAAYAVYETHRFSLTIQNTLGALTLALPAVAGLALETSTALAASFAKNRKLRRRHASNIPAVLLPSTLTILLLVVYETVVATLSGTHISPVGGLGCALRERWTELFREKNGERIRTIQDALSCCGFASTKDMAFPLPSQSHGIRADECVRITGRAIACEPGWRDMERRVAGLMIAVAVGTFVWMAIIIATPAIHPSWARDTLRLAPGTDTSVDAEARRVIEYEPYSDDPVGDETTEEARRQVAGLNDQSKLASYVEAARTRPSALLGENQWARASDDI